MSNSEKKGGVSTELKNLKEAIIDLYLAIKIRSTEEVSLHFSGNFNQTTLIIIHSQKLRF